MGNLGLATSLLFEPRKAFTEIDAKPRFWFPLLVLVIATVILGVWYRSVVDLEWVTDRTIRASAFASRLTEAQIEAVVKRSVDNRTLGTVSSVLAIPAVLAFIALMKAIYLMLAGKITHLRRSFRHWFSLACWCSLPVVLSSVAGAFVLLTATTTQIDQADLNPISLNSLLFQRSPGEPGYSLFSYVDPLQLFAIFLLVVGVRTWSGRSWLFSAIFALLPYALIYGIWAFISLR
jgi:Yip1 domain